MTQPHSDLSHSGFVLLTFVSLFPFPPFLHEDVLGNKDPNTHIPAKALVWSPPNLLVKATSPTGCRLTFGPASAVEAGSSSPHGGEGLETSIFLRLLRRSHLPSLALLSHTHTYMYLYIWVTLYIYRSDISTWIYPGRCSLCPSTLWLPTCCLLVLIQLALGSKLTSYMQYSYRDQPEAAGIQISVMFLVPLVSCSFQSSPPRGIFPEAPAFLSLMFTGSAERRCPRKPLLLLASQPYGHLWGQWARTKPAPAWQSYNTF